MAEVILTEDMIQTTEVEGGEGGGTLGEASEEGAVVAMNPMKEEGGVSLIPLTGDETVTSDEASAEDGAGAGDAIVRVLTGDAVVVGVWIGKGRGVAVEIGAATVGVCAVTVGVGAVVVGIGVAVAAATGGVIVAAEATAAGVEVAALLEA